jgi:hypothetical protein
MNSKGRVKIKKKEIEEFKKKKEHFNKNIDYQILKKKTEISKINKDDIYRNTK